MVGLRSRPVIAGNPVGVNLSTFASAYKVIQRVVERAEACGGAIAIRTGPDTGRPGAEFATFVLVQRDMDKVAPQVIKTIGDLTGGIHKVNGGGYQSIVACVYLSIGTNDLPA